MSLRLLRAALILFAAIIAVQATLGAAGVLTSGALALAFVVLATGAGAVMLTMKRLRGTVATAAPDFGANWGAADWAGAAALITALADRCWAGLHRSTFLYDVLSYHLHLPASWRAAERLYIVPTPFGDPAAAYAPANAELVYHLLLAATGNARLAHAGQLPFAALAALALYTTARVLGARPAAGFVAALAFLLVPEVWQQAPTAMADLGTAAFFLASLPFLLLLSAPGQSAGETGALVPPTVATPGTVGFGARPWSTVVPLGLALGLLVGTKYIGLVLSLPLLLWSIIALWRRPLTHAPSGRQAPTARARAGAICTLLALILGSGGFWYIRNLLVTGNPMFPATLALGRWTIARGLVDPARLRASVYHLPIKDLKALGEILREGGWGLLAAWFIALGTLARGGARGSWRWVALAASLLALTWVVVPYQESRFFFSLWGVVAVTGAASAVPFRPLTSMRPPGGSSARAFTTLAALAATVGSIVEYGTQGRWAVLGAAAAGALVGPALGRTLARLPWRRRSAAGLASGLALLATALLAAVSWARINPVPPAAYAVGDTHDPAWRWLGAHVHGQTVAYTGSNLPFPLWGAKLENRVYYASVAGPVCSAAPHHHLDVSPTASTMTSTEPAPEREFPRRSVWLSNLRVLGVEVLVVAAMYPHVQETIVRHDQGGFPIERDWADADPEQFALRFANEGMRIYAVRGLAPGNGRP